MFLRGDRARLKRTESQFLVDGGVLVTTRCDPIGVSGPELSISHRCWHGWLGLKIHPRSFLPNESITGPHRVSHFEFKPINCLCIRLDWAGGTSDRDKRHRNEKIQNELRYLPTIKELNKLGRWQISECGPSG